MKKKISKRIISVFLILLIMVNQPYADSFGLQVQAANKVLTLKQAQNTALARSQTRVKIGNKIELQEIKYAAAVKSIQMKKKNMSTFRWTPLLSFKFPEQPTLADEYEWQYKPLQITSTITELKHQLQDEVFANKETVSNLYVALYISQQKIAFMEDNLEQAKQNKERNQAKLVIGQANQSDIDKMEQSISRLTTDISLQKRTFETNKSKLSDLMNQDITTGYSFANPLVQAEIPRSILENLVTYTLNNDQSFYEAKMDTRLAYTGMDMMESMMRNQYGSKMDSIMPFINQIKAGNRVDSAAFKGTYKSMLSAVDAPWNGKLRILFIRINREWFKGAVDGSRYVEDDPYALYSGALEYMDALKEENALKKELTNQVKDGFETLKTAQIAYTDAQKTCEQLAEDLQKSSRLNMLGKLSYEELSDLQEEYKQQELDTLDLLAEYSKLLYSYDRLTCGGITAYLEGTDVDMQAAQGGNSFLADELKGKVYYYISYKIEDNLFIFGVSIPEDYSLDITDFALYVDGIRIGDITPVTETLEHLALDLDEVNETQVYLYNGEDLVDVCEFDSTVNQAELEVTGGYTLVSETSWKTVANYTYSIQENSNLVTMKITPKDADIAYYKLADAQGKAIFDEQPIPVEESFTYLSLLVGDFTDLQIIFYDTSQQELYKGHFETGNSSIVAIDS